MTLTYREVHRARDLLWVVTGEEKVGALPDAHVNEDDAACMSGREEYPRRIWR